MTEGIDFIDTVPSGFLRNSSIYFDKQNHSLLACFQDALKCAEYS
jgi:hypothetical protein